MKVWKVFFILLLAMVSYFSAIQTVRAVVASGSGIISTQVVINEVHPDPSVGNDWFELKNQGTTSAVLESWSVEDMSSVLTPHPSFTGLSIPPNGYVVIDVSNRLNSPEDMVILKNPSGQIVDQFHYTSVQKDLSWSRSPDGIGNFVLSSPSAGTANPTVPTSPSPSPTPSSSPTPSPLSSPSPAMSPSPLPSPLSSPTPNPSPSPSPTLSSQPDQVWLSEIMACPETGQSEWIELYNPYSVGYQLSNWKLVDSGGHTRSLNLSIPAQGFGVFSISPDLLNNSGDSVSIIRPDGQVVSSASFGSCTKGKSFVISNNVWLETDEPTPGSFNRLVPADNTATSTNTSDNTNIETTALSSNQPSDMSLPSLSSSVMDPQSTVGLLSSSSPDSNISSTQSAIIASSAAYPINSLDSGLGSPSTPDLHANTPALHNSGVEYQLAFLFGGTGIVLLISGLVSSIMLMKDNASVFFPSASSSPPQESSSFLRL